MICSWRCAALLEQQLWLRPQRRRGVLELHSVGCILSPSALLWLRPGERGVDARASRSVWKTLARPPYTRRRAVRRPPRRSSSSPSASRLGSPAPTRPSGRPPIACSPASAAPAPSAPACGAVRSQACVHVGRGGACWRTGKGTGRAPCRVLGARPGRSWGPRFRRRGYDRKRRGRSHPSSGLSPRCAAEAILRALIGSW